MRDVLELLLAERYGPTPRPDVEDDTPEVIRARQHVLAEMPGDEEPLTKDHDDQQL
ncbi:hypothetical protein K1W54_04830 [Micromonospora sp. CPCC 205371]|nr:hypothetical protein [Micromonospora sp. CPCC 205371]